MNSRPNCQARVIGDQYRCDKCGLVWDISDLDPPDCKTVFIDRANRLILENSTYGKPSIKDPEVEKKEVEKMRDILKPERCRHGVPLNSKCRNCDISNYKKRMENEQ